MEKENGVKIRMTLNAIDMWENTGMIKSMERDLFIGKVATFTWEIIMMMKEMDLVKCTSLMELFMKDNGVEEFNQVKVRLFCLMAQSKWVISKTMSSMTIIHHTYKIK